MTIQRHTAAGWIVKARYNAAECGLAYAGHPDQRYAPTAGYAERQIAQHILLSIGIAKPYVLKRDIAAHMLERIPS